MCVASSFLQPRSTIVGLIEHPLWEKRHHDAIRSSTSLDTTCCIAWHSCRKPQWEHLRVLGRQSEDSAHNSEFGEFNGDYQETPSARSDKKRTLTFVGEIMSMIGRDPSKSVSEGISQGHGSVWLSYQADSAWRHSVFFIQDGQRRTLAWLSDNFSDHSTPDMWPPNSPDCNPLDYYVWGEVERETNATLCNTKDELRARIMAIFPNLNKETVQKSCSRFRSRLEVVVEANDDLLNNCTPYYFKIFLCNLKKYML